LFLSHCVPYPPDKGERIRAHHLLQRLVTEYNVHVACFARDRAQMEDARGLEGCASVYVERLSKVPAMARGAAGFLAGRCLSAAFFSSRRMAAHVEQLRSRPLAAAVVYSSIMARYAPPQVPMLLDMVDVDSEKWRQYAAMRQPALAYRAEARRLRRIEREAAARAQCTFLATESEMRLFQKIAPGLPVECVENGVDFSYFDPAANFERLGLARRRFAVFLGAMDYYPNIDAACRFAEEILPVIRRRDPSLEFFVVGRNPHPRVKRLGGRPGITVTGAVPDVRPYLSQAQALVAPLRIARGIQNKVIEALAMGKPAIVSPEVCHALGHELPEGVILSETGAGYAAALQNLPAAEPARIRNAARKRFTWSNNLERVASRIAEAITDRRAIATAAE
jgi:sugar transferase (PEP-CTERM/EpsH1 system associated)